MTAELKPSLVGLRRKIRLEKPYVDIRPFSHNIINNTLREIAKYYCKHEANKAIRDFGLDTLGWEEEDIVCTGCGCK